jgi:hypothetical protein
VGRTGVPCGVDRTAIRLTEWADHVSEHDVRLREYWLAQPVVIRLAAAMRCRRRVNGLLPPLDRTHLRVIDLDQLE